MLATQFCGQHSKDRWKSHGRIDEVLPLEMYEKFRKEWEKRQSKQSRRRSKHWYTRHHMWMSAVNVRKKTMKERPELQRDVLENLYDLSVIPVFEPFFWVCKHSLSVSECRIRGFFPFFLFFTIYLKYFRKFGI